MSCLLPQFKCLPDTFSFHSKTHLQPTIQLLKCRESIYFRLQCVLSTAAPPSTATATAIDVEKLLSLNLEAQSNPPDADRPWTYVPTETKFGASLATETLLRNEEATIAAAAAEAVALAKSAVRVAKEAAMMVSHNSSATLDGKLAVVPSEASTLSDIRRVGVAGDLTAAASGLWGNFPLQYPIINEDYWVPISEELKPFDPEFLNVAVRSRRQTERKARREKAAVKAAADIVVSAKPGPTRRKKKASPKHLNHNDPLRYFRGSTRSKLLTFVEERQLSEGVQDLLKLEKLQSELAERCGVQPTFMQWAAAAGVDQITLRKRVDHGAFCKEKMIKSNIRLVISIAKKFQGTGMNIQDLVQEGCRGLVKGIEKFDASKGFKFSTYGHWWIKQAIQRFISEQSRIIRLPFHMVEATYKVKTATKQLYSDMGRQPNHEELAEATGLSMKRLQAVLLASKAPTSLDQKFGELEFKFSEVIADPNAITSEQIWMKQCVTMELEKVLNTLRRREKEVLRMRYGLEGGRMKTLQEIGDSMGISRERIRQIEMCAVRKLKSKRRTKNFLPYLVAYSESQSQ